MTPASLACWLGEAGWVRLDVPGLACPGSVLGLLHAWHAWPAACLACLACCLPGMLGLLPADCRLPWPSALVCVVNWPKSAILPCLQSHPQLAASLMHAHLCLLPAHCPAHLLTLSRPK